MMFFWAKENPKWSQYIPIDWIFKKIETVTRAHRLRFMLAEFVWQNEAMNEAVFLAFMEIVSKMN